MSAIIVEKLYLFIIPTFFICFFSIIIILPYSAFLYKKIQKIEPEFFFEKNICYYMAKLNPTQFIFYIFFNHCKKIKDPTLRKKCGFLRNYLCIIIFLFITMVVMGIFANYYFQNRPFPQKLL